MPVSGFQSLMLPILKALADGEEVSVYEARTCITYVEGIIFDEMRELLPSASSSPACTEPAH